MNDNANLTILFISSAPSDMPRLRLAQELKDIQEIIKRQGKFILSHCLCAKPTDLTQAFLDYKPYIVHYAGHGLKTGELCFENDLNEMQPVEPDVLADLFELISDQTNCVLLNSCYSKIQADAIVKHISYVIGMNQSIGDKAAISFATGFYKAIVAGHSVEKAFKFGRVEMRLNRISEYQTPRLHIREKSIILKEVPIVQWELKLEGTLTDDNKRKAQPIVDELCRILGDSSLKMKKVEQGSIRIFLEGSKDEFEIFKELFESGRLTEILGFQIESVQSSELKVPTFQENQDINLVENNFVTIKSDLQRLYLSEYDIEDYSGLYFYVERYGRKRKNIVDNVAVKANRFFLYVLCSSCALYLFIFGSSPVKIGILGAILLSLLLRVFVEYLLRRKRRKLYADYISIREDYLKFCNHLKAIEQLDNLGRAIPNRSELLETLTKVRNILINAFRTEQILRDDPYNNVLPEILKSSMTMSRDVFFTISDKVQEYSDTFEDIEQTNLAIQKELHNLYSKIPKISSEDIKQTNLAIQKKLQKLQNLLRV